MRERSRQAGQFAESLRKSWRRNIVLPYYFIYPYLGAVLVYYIYEGLDYGFAELGWHNLFVVFIIPVVVLWQLMEGRALRQMGGIGYELIFRYDIWYMVEYGSAIGVLSKLVSKAFLGLDGNIDSPKSFLKRLWTYSSSGYTIVLGDHYKSYAAFEGMEQPRWASDIALILRQVWNMKAETIKVLGNVFKSLYIIYIIAIVTRHLFIPLTQHMLNIYIWYGYILLIITIGLAILPSRICSIAFAAGYYKMLTDNWPWENAGE